MSDTRDFELEDKDENPQPQPKKIGGTPSFDDTSHSTETGKVARMFEILAEDDPIGPYEELQEFLTQDLKGVKVKFEIMDDNLQSHVIEEVIKEAKIIGSGTFGFVYRLEFERNSMNIAFKLIDHGKRVDVDIALFEKKILGDIEKIGKNDAPKLEDLGVQAKRLTKISIPAKTTYRDYELQGEGIAMEYIKGIKLTDYLMNVDNQDPAKFINEIFVPAAVSLVRFINNGIIPLDIKPDNIIVDNNGKVIWVDWGLAILGVLEEDKFNIQAPFDAYGLEILGSPPYSFPLYPVTANILLQNNEQLRGFQFFQNTAVWSFLTMIFAELYHVSPIKVPILKDGVHSMEIITLYGGHMSHNDEVQDYFETLNYGTVDESMFTLKDFLTLKAEHEDESRKSPIPIAQIVNYSEDTQKIIQRIMMRSFRVLIGGHLKESAKEEYDDIVAFREYFNYQGFQVADLANPEVVCKMIAEALNVDKTKTEQ